MISVVMFSLDLNQDVQVVRMGGVRPGGIRIWKIMIRVPVSGHEYLVAHIWMSH
jgi:hypothetical protein